MMDAPEEAWADSLADALGRAVERQARIPAGVLDFTGDPQPGQPVCYVPPGATAAEAEAMVAAAHPVVYRRVRAKRPAVIEETPRRPPAPFMLLKNGVPCVSIPLHGEHGEGRRAILDLLQWERVQALVGGEWAVRATDSGLSVVSYRQRARGLAGSRDGTAAFMVLSRFVAGAQDGEVVGFKDGDPFHIRRCNLVVEGRKAHWDAHRVRQGHENGEAEAS